MCKKFRSNHGSCKMPPILLNKYHDKENTAMPPPLHSMLVKLMDVASQLLPRWTYDYLQTEPNRAMSNPANHPFFILSVIM